MRKKRIRTHNEQGIFIAMIENTRVRRSGQNNVLQHKTFCSLFFGDSALQHSGECRRFELKGVLCREKNTDADVARGYEYKVTSFICRLLCPA